MCSDCNAARTYQNGQRRYDDPPAAELVQNPLHKWKFYTREVFIRRRNFQAILAEGRKALAAVAEKRLALGQSPDIEAQRVVYEGFEHVDMHFGAGAMMSSLDVSEAIGEAQQGLPIVRAALSQTSESGQRDASRQARLARYDRETEDDLELWREQLSSEREAIQKALPDYQSIDPKFEIVSSFDW